MKARCNTSFDCEDGSDENYCELVVIHKKSYRKINPPDSKIRTVITGKSFSGALILPSTNPQYDKRLFIELPVQCMKTTGYLIAKCVK